MPLTDGFSDTLEGRRSLNEEVRIGYSGSAAPEGGAESVEKTSPSIAGKAARRWFHRSQRNWTWRIPSSLFWVGWARNRDRTRDRDYRGWRSEAKSGREAPGW